MDLSELIAKRDKLKNVADEVHRETQQLESLLGTRLDLPIESMHGRNAKSSWEGPTCVAVSDMPSRSDQLNTLRSHEYIDNQIVLKEKMEMIAKLLKESKHCVLYCGAGLSKSCGIPDYATHAKKSVSGHEELPEIRDALPSKAHHIIANMEKEGFIAGFLQQNHDG